MAKQSIVSQPDRIPLTALVSASAVLLWCAQPPFGLASLAWIALVPALCAVARDQITRRQWWIIYAVGVGYWLATMQGLRHAHPAMYATWTVFGFYLGAYWFTLLWLAHGSLRSQKTRIPPWISIAMIGVGLECVRNYLLTGISAAMIGHSQANVPAVIQIADVFGSYGVSYVVLLVNTAIAHAWIHRGETIIRRFRPMLVAGSIMIATLVYGAWRLGQADQDVDASGVNIAIVGRDEEIIFVQDASRELEIFDAYFRGSMEAATAAERDGVAIDAIVWPESMFNGSLPWLLIDENSINEGDAEQAETLAIIRENRTQFTRRAAQVQSAIRRVTGQQNDPHLIVGCSVVRYQEPLQSFSGIVHVGQRGEVLDWYGKTHLVMFGEYIPLIDYLPFIQSFIPPGMGIERGPGAKSWDVNGLFVSPNICIETAVERITPNQVTDLISREQSPDVIVNVTNDGWFDHSSIVSHHLRSTQLVAVACRRPILIAANGGPTAWIDGSGRIVERLRSDLSGAIIANVVTDGREAWFLRIGDWPARAMAAYVMVLVVMQWRIRRRVSVTV